MSRTIPQSEAVLHAVEGEARLDPIAKSLTKIVQRAVPPGNIRDVLHGVWLGHPLHPLLTDLPIGAWTSAWMLDIVGGERGARAAQMLVGVGCLAAIPTAISGAVDWSRTDTVDQRVGVVHAVSNSVALALYSLSWMERRSGRRRLGIALGMGGATAATVGGFLGGHLVYRRSIGASRVAEVKPPTDWTDVGDPSDANTVATNDDVILVAKELGTGISARCSHEGGPLPEGEFVGSGTDRCVVCPWHSSTFRLVDGSVAHGPATSPQPAYDVQESNGRWRVRGQSSRSGNSLP